MSILKGILHHWNKTTKSYDTIHPETEVAQITDWNNGIVNTLASTGLSSLVNVLSSDSLLSLLIKKVFDATGVKYNIAQNGYVCFGSLVGGLIIQWGKIYTAAGSLFATFPLQFAKEVYAIVCTEADAGMWQSNQAVLSGVASGITISGFTVHSRWIDNGVVITNGETISYIAIGR